MLEFLGSNMWAVWLVVVLSRIGNGGAYLHLVCSCGNSCFGVVDMGRQHISANHPLSCSFGSMPFLLQEVFCKEQERIS